MSKTILVPVDSSPMSERAAPYAIQLARDVDGRLIFVEAVQISLLPSSEARAYNRDVTQEPRQQLGRLASHAREQGVSASWLMPNDEPGPGIVDSIQRSGADLVVMATHARSTLGRLVFGSVTDWVLRHAEVPVLAVPESAVGTWPEARPARLVVSLDGSALSEQVLSPVTDLAGDFGAELVLVRAVEPASYDSGSDPGHHPERVRDYLERHRVRLEGSGLRAQAFVGIGAPSDVILEAARTYEARIIAMATHGRSGMTRLLLGSQAGTVLRRASVPILLVRPGKGARREAAEGPAEKENGARLVGA